MSQRLKVRSEEQTNPSSRTRTRRGELELASWEGRREMKEGFRELTLVGVGFLIRSNCRDKDD